MRLSVLALLIGTGSALFVSRVAPCLRPSSTRTVLLRASADEYTDGRSVRVSVPIGTELIAARTTTQKKKKGIRSVKLGSTEINFSHDMTNTFLWSGITLSLLAVKVGKLAAQGNLRAVLGEEANYNHIARTDAEEAELHEFCCSECGYTMFPARGRDSKFFPDDFKCPNEKCKAPKESFFDMTDMSDPRTVDALQNDEDFDYEIEDIVVTIKDDDDGASPDRRLSAPTPKPDAPQPAASPPSSSSPLPPPPPTVPPTFPTPPSQSGSDDDGFDPLGFVG